MIDLAWPWMFLLLPLPLLAYYALPPAGRGANSALRIPFFGDLQQIQSETAQRQGRATRLIAPLLVWLFLLLAAAQPQWLGDQVELPQSGRDLMLAIDISGSMETPDLDQDDQSLTRLDVVKEVAGRFIQQRTNDRVGLILFGRRAYLQTPLTFDHQTVDQMLGESEIGLAGKETAIGDAIGLAIKRLSERPETNRVLILLTDGANTAGEITPRRAAQLAQKAGLRIYTIGVGAERIKVQTLFGTRTVNPSRDLDEKTLQVIAQATDGKYFRARDVDALGEVYEQLNQLEPVEQESRIYRPHRSLYHWPLGIAFLLSLIMVMTRAARMGVLRRVEVEQ